MVIIALDFENKERTLDFLKNLKMKSCLLR